MAVMKMIAVTMIGPHDEMEPVARQMVLSGGFQPIPIDFLVTDRSLRLKVSTISENPYDDLLAKSATIWRVAGAEAPEPMPVAVEHGFSYDKAKALVTSTIGKLDIWDRRRQALREELDGLQATKKYVEALNNLNMRPDELTSAEYLSVRFGSLTPENMTRLTESTIESPLLVMELSRTQESVWVMVFTVPGFLESARKILASVYFREYSLDEITRRLSLEDPIAQIDRSVKFHERAIEGLEKAASKLLEDRRQEFEELYSKLYTMQRVYDLCKGRGEVSGMYILSGWMPEDLYMKVKPAIEGEASMSSIIVEQVKDMPYRGVRIPTMLSNNRFIRAFQDVVAMYSVPSYGEVDPSPFVAMTFILFFGFMFGDIGHGALLFAGAWWLSKKRILSKSLAYVMKCASISSMVFGALYGSVMGMEDLIPALWLSPMKDTGKLFGVAILAGVAVISAGMILNMIMRWRDRDFGRLLFDGQGLAGLFVYWGAAAAIFITVMDVAIPFPVAYLWYAIIAMLLVTVFRDTLARLILHEESAEKASGTLHAFEILHNLMNYFTNTASFVRLAAFALNHVALSFAVMLISNMLADLSGGPVLKILVLVIGNLFIVGLEGLIVFIQVLRLEYYEFFSKFYRGGGNVFRPIAWKPERALQKR